MNIAQNFHPSIKPEFFNTVRLLWQTHNPQRIAQYLNTKYSLYGSLELDGRAVENMHQRIARLDSGEVEG